MDVSTHTHYYVRQLRDMKGGVEFDLNKSDSENMPQYCSLCAWALALSHAKSGDAAYDFRICPAMATSWDEAMVRFAFAYADQTEKITRRLLLQKERTDQSCKGG